MTVAVSIAVGVASLTAAFPGLTSATVPVCLGILALIALLNLRGLADAARGFLLPTLVFVIGLMVIIIIGLIHPLALHAAQPGRSLLPAKGLEAVGVLMVLKAFSAGCSALTGVGAIANGVPLFKEPRAARAKQTVLSQIIGEAIGRGWAYQAMAVIITLVLALAANTSFGGLPVLASLLSRDNYLPHLFGLRDDRQVVSAGIWALAILAGALLIAVNGNTLTLIPLYAIGVFTGTGAVVTAVATVIFLITKFTEGAWVVVLTIPAFIALFVWIHRYYHRVAQALGFGSVPGQPEPKPSMGA